MPLGKSLNPHNSAYSCFYRPPWAVTAVTGEMVWKWLAASQTSSRSCTSHAPKFLAGDRHQRLAAITRDPSVPGRAEVDPCCAHSSPWPPRNWDEDSSSWRQRATPVSPPDPPHWRSGDQRQHILYGCKCLWWFHTPRTRKTKHQGSKYEETQAWADSSGHGDSRILGWELVFEPKCHPLLLDTGQMLGLRPDIWKWFLLLPNESESISHSVVSDSLWPHRGHCSPSGKNTGIQEIQAYRNTSGIQGDTRIQEYRQEYRSGLPFLSPGDFPDPGIEPRSLVLQADPLMFEPPGTSTPSTYNQVI